MSTRPKFIDAVTVIERMSDFDSRREILAEDELDPMAGAQLELTYRRNGEWRELMDLLLTRAEHTEDPAEAVEFMIEAAAAAMQLCDRDSARLILLTAFEHLPSSYAVANELDRLGFDTGDWQETLNSYLLAAAHADDPNLKGSLWLRTACAHAVSTRDVESLMAALERIESVDRAWAQQYLDAVEAQANTPALLALLAQLCARIDDPERRARCLTRAIPLSQSKAERAGYHHLLGAQLEGAEDPAEAEWHFREALRLAPGRASSHAHLVALLKRTGRLREAASMLTSQALGGEDRGDERGEAAYEAALLFSELDEDTRCYDMLSVTIAQNPGHIEAAIVLAERYYQEKRWPELEVLVDLLVERDRDMPEATRLQHRQRAGECATALQKWDRARHHYSAALQLCPDDIGILKALAMALSELGDLPAAYDTYERLLDLHAGEGHTETRADLLCKMAVVRQGQRQIMPAVQLCVESLDLNPYAREPARVLAELYEEAGHPTQAITMRRRLIALGDPQQIIAEHREIARLHHVMGDPYAAFVEYQTILTLAPDDREALHQILEHHTAAEQWEQAASTILTIAALDNPPSRRARYLQAAGIILWDKCQNPAAGECLSDALRAYIEADSRESSERQRVYKCFDRLAALHRQTRNFKQLEASYKRLVQWTNSDDPRAATLWQELGDLYKDHMQRPMDAVTAYEVAATLQEDNTHFRRTLAELYASLGQEKRQEAIDSRRLLLAGHPEEAEHYRALYSLYLQNEQYDRAWCAARALVFMKQADAEERAFYEQYAAYQPALAERPLDRAQWRELRHADECGPVAGVFSLLGDIVLRKREVSIGRLAKRDGKTEAHEELRQILGGVAYALGLPEMPIFVDLEASETVVVLPCDGGYALVAGGGLRTIEGLRARVYTVARTLASARVTTRLRLAVRSLEELEAAYWGAARLLDSTVRVPSSAEAESLAAANFLRQTLPAAARLRLAQELAKVEPGQERESIRSWFDAVDATARRAATLLCGDLTLAASAIENEAAWRRESAAPMLADMLVSSVSEPHAALRRDLRNEVPMANQAAPISF
jgi:tetratricopeptide (TPR) repeat protein